MVEFNTHSDAGIVRPVSVIEVRLGNHVVHKCLLKRNNTVRMRGGGGGGRGEGSFIEQ